MKITNTVKTIKLLAILFISALTFTACSEDDHDDHDHEEEVITTVNYTLTSGSDVVTLTYRDLDGEGGNEGVTTVSGSLSANTTYAGAIELLNETESPAENMTEEIEEEDEDIILFEKVTDKFSIFIEKYDELDNFLILSYLNFL